MKPETLAKDLSLYDNMLRLSTAIENQKRTFMEMVDNLSADAKNFQDLMELKTAQNNSNKKFKNLPVERRNTAIANHKFGSQIGSATAHYGVHYSGNTHFTVVFDKEAAAFTNTTTGDGCLRRFATHRTV